MVYLKIPKREGTSIRLWCSAIAGFKIAPASHVLREEYLRIPEARFNKIKNWTLTRNCGVVYRVKLKGDVSW